MEEKYQLRGNPVKDVPIIGNLVHDDLGKEVIAKLNESFKGVEGIKYSHKHEANEPISYSNVPRILRINGILRSIDETDALVLSLTQIVKYWDRIPERGITYADPDSIVAFPNEGPNEELRQRVLKLTGKTSKLPLIVSGLDVERTDNNLGFTFIGTDYMKAVEAPFLTKNGKVAYDSSKEDLVSSGEGVSVWTPMNQSGLRRLCRDGSDGLDAGDDSLLYANGCGRVQLISGVATSPDLEAYLVQLETKRIEAQKTIERIQKAEAILRGE